MVKVWAFLIALFIALGFSGMVPILKDLEIRKNGEGLLPGQSNAFDWIASAFPSVWRRMATAGPERLHPEGKPFLPSDYFFKLDHGVDNGHALAIG